MVTLARIHRDAPLVTLEHETLTAIRAAMPGLLRAVLVLSSPGLRAEAAEQGVPLEVVEFQATKAAAADIAVNYGVNERRATQALSNVVAAFSD